MIARPPPAGFWMPTRAQLKSTYEGIVEGQAEAGNLKKLSRAPAGSSQVTPFKNVGIKGMKGREDIFEVKGDLYLKNTQGSQTTWYKAGPAPLF